MHMPHPVSISESMIHQSSVTQTPHFISNDVNLKHGYKRPKSSQNKAVRMKAVTTEQLIGLCVSETEHLGRQKCSSDN